MLYLKNSLVNLTIILFSLFFLTVLSADENGFIFPKKKNITVNFDTKKLNKIKQSKDFKDGNLPQKNPLREKLNTQIK